MSKFEFDTLYSAITGARIRGFAPYAEDSGSIDVNGCDLLIAGDPDSLSEWGQITGKTRQHGYRGAIFHPSETADDDTIREWVREAGGDVFSLVAVNIPQCDDYITHGGCECDSQCYRAPVAGWAIIYRDADNLAPAIDPGHHAERYDPNLFPATESE